MRAETMARMENILRPFITQLPPKTAVYFYSTGRRYFLRKLASEMPPETYAPPEEMSRTLWEIKFRSPIMNAAGMFKNGECYEMVSDQGAGGYLGGTGTWNSRRGNKKDGIYLPFVPYPRSHSSSNFLGLPNDGDGTNFEKAADIVSSKRVEGCPVGWSIMGSPDYIGEKKLYALVTGMMSYELAGVDFLEINESCPNTADGKPQDNDLAKRLTYVKNRFLDERPRRLPVIVKFSNDTEPEQIPALMDLLFELGYDGANFGNTSTQYERRRVMIHPEERKLYDFFTSCGLGVGGGISGKPLKESSLELAGRAAEYAGAGSPSQEFHVIRTGGIESWKDIDDSERAGIPLNGWFTGYWEGFDKYGHDVYKRLYEESA